MFEGLAVLARSVRNMGVKFDTILKEQRRFQFEIGRDEGGPVYLMTSARSPVPERSGEWRQSKAGIRVKNSR